MPFQMVRNDITRVAADAIVNPANQELRQGSGTSRAIYQAAGEPTLTAACKAIGHCAPGRAVLTPAFRLQAKYILHAVCPAWQGGKDGEAEQLADAYRAALKLAAECGCESVAFPLLSAGNYGYPKAEALRVAVDAITAFLAEQDLTVFLVLYDRDSLLVGQKLSSSVEEYIDDHYVLEKDESYAPGRLRRELWNRARDPVGTQTGSLEHWMDGLGEGFTARLLRLIAERGLKDSTVYKRANLSRQHFSKIQCNADYRPKKKTVLAFAIGLRLSEAETAELLQSAGYAFSDGSRQDLVVRYCLQHQIYNINQVNLILFQYDQEQLGA